MSSTSTEEVAGWQSSGQQGQADAGGWQRMHKLTPLIKGWTYLLGVIAVVSHSVLGGSLDLSHSPAKVLPAFAVMAAVVLAIVVLACLSWWTTAYRLGEAVIQHRKGILFRQTRQAPLDRLQAVDVVQPLLGRIVGLSELRLEVAGGTGGDFRLAYLSDANAQRLRRVLLAQAAGLSLTDGQAGEQEAPEAPQHQVYELSTGTMVAAGLHSTGTLMAALWVVGAMVTSLVVGSATVLLALLPGLFTTATVVWASFNSHFGFTVATSPDGIRLRHGLLERRSQTVPPGRVQALEISQPLLWKGRGWWMIKMNVAGYANNVTTDQLSAVQTLLVPVATIEQVALVISLVLPDVGVPDPREVLRAGLLGRTGDGSTDGFVVAPTQARWLAPVTWSRRGVMVTDRCVLARSGRLRRYLRIVAHERMQAVGVRQGPLQRRLGLASVVVHSTRGPVRPRVDHLRVADAAALVSAQSARARDARAVAQQQQWMRQVAPVLADALAAGSTPSSPNLPTPPQ